MPAPTEVLQRVPLFSDLDRRDLERIAGSMKERTFEAGDTVLVEGESGVGFFVIDTGTATVSVGGEERRKLGPGDYFGEVALLAQTERTATLTADGELRCYGLTSWAFRPIIEENASLAWKLLQSLGKMLSDRQRG
ncbi:MAG: cyclic nucleotide-binding domain-containing protein [Thermoleophilia bacterium]